jgi:hypothetical protein
MSSKATNRPWLGKTQFTFSCARLSATEVLGRSLIVVELPRMKKANSGRPIRFRKSSYLTDKRFSLLHTRHFGREGPIDFHKLVVHLPFVLTMKNERMIYNQKSRPGGCVTAKKVRRTGNSSSSKSVEVADVEKDRICWTEVKTAREEETRASSNLLNIAETKMVYTAAANLLDN